MRRGLMAIAENEVPTPLLERRIDALLAALSERRLDALLAYTDFTRPRAVWAVTHFVPYWSNALLIVAPQERATLVATLSRRVSEWIQSVARIGELVSTQDLGGAAAQRLAERSPGARRIGVVDLANWPQAAIGALRRGLPQAQLEDATDWFDAVIAAHPLPDLIHPRTVAIAEQGLAAAQRANDGTAATIVAAAERACRAAGAEEVLIAVAPDLRRDPRLRRIEGDAALGERHALQVSVAYKGHWLRCARTMTRGDAPDAIASAQAWFDRLVDSLPAAPDAAAAVRDAAPPIAGARLESWTIETGRGSLPLAVVAGTAPYPDRDAAPAGARTLSLRLRLDDGWWLAAAAYIDKGDHRDA